MATLWLIPHRHRPGVDATGDVLYADSARGDGYERGSLAGFAATAAVHKAARVDVQRAHPHPPARQRARVPRMPVASFASIQLVRFDQLREAGPVPVNARPGVLFCGVAADTRAAGTEPASQQAFTF